MANKTVTNNTETNNSATNNAEPNNTVTNTTETGKAAAGLPARPRHDVESPVSENGEQRVMEAVGQLPALPRSIWLRLAGLLTTVTVAVFLALLTYLQPGAHLVPGLDSSWAYALNYIYQHGLVMGRDILFTFGPLGFLEHTRDLTSDIVYQSSVFWFAVSVLVNATLLVLAFVGRVPWWHRGINLLLVLVLVFMANTQIQRLLLLLYVCVFLHWHSRHLFYLVLLAVGSAACLLIKFSYGVVALAMTGPYLLLVSWRDRHPGALLVGMAVILACYMGSWLVIYGHLEGMAGYIRGGLEFSRGSTSAMALNPENQWHFIACYYAGFMGALYLVGREHRARWLPLSLCFIGPLFIWSKYAFGREDSGHVTFLMLFVVYLLPVMALASERLSIKFGHALALGLCLFGWHNMHTPQIGPPVYPGKPFYFEPYTFMARLNPGDLLGIWQAESSKRLESLRLPPGIRQQLGQRTVDIYPWESLITAANDLNWVPRPVFQSYITYTPALDQANAAFFASERAPEFLLWHYHTFADIDNRYPFSSDPLTLAAILRHYRQAVCEGQFCLWTRTAENQLEASTIQPSNTEPSTTEPSNTELLNTEPSATETSHTGASVTAQWNEWVPVPETDKDIVQASMAINRTVRGKLNLAVWKEGGVSIDYRLRDGTVQTHALVVDNAVSGVWVSPYITTFYQASRVGAVPADTVAAYLAAPRAEGFIETLKAVPNGIHLAGWGLAPFHDTQTQVLKAILFNEQRAYEAILLNRHRPGISEYFGKQGEVDLDHCGFDEVIPTHDMVPGEYNVRFVVENAVVENAVVENVVVGNNVPGAAVQEQVVQQQAVQQQAVQNQKVQNQKVQNHVVQDYGYRVTVASTRTAHNVEAIRVRTTRPWAFTPTVQLDWQGQTFMSRPPW